MKSIDYIAYWGVNPYQLDWDELCEWGYVAIDGKTCSRSDRYEKAKDKTFNLKQTLIFEKINISRKN